MTVVRQSTRMTRLVSWILLASALTVAISCHQICFIGSEYKPQSGTPPRWFLPYKDPCKCTAVRVGGVGLPASSYHQGAPYYLDELFLSEDVDEIQTYYNCSRLATVLTAVCSSPGEPLGMESGNITDDRITASSTSIASRKGRLNARGAWISNIKRYDADPWIEVDLVTGTVVTGVITQGLKLVFVVHYVSLYKVAYKKQSSSVYEHVTDGNGNMEFSGNTDANTPVINMFDESVVAVKVRIEPTETNKLDLSYHLRFELLGCRSG